MLQTSPESPGASFETRSGGALLRMRAEGLGSAKHATQALSLLSFAIRKDIIRLFIARTCR
jgi:hypothetical protein